MRGFCVHILEFIYTAFYVIITMLGVKLVNCPDAYKKSKLVLQTNLLPNTYQYR